MLTAVALGFMLLGFLCVGVACTMDLAPKEAYRRSMSRRRTRKKTHKLSKLRKAA